MDISRITALGRFIDLRYASNRFVVAATVLAGAITAAARWATDDADPLLWGFRSAAGVFLAWAVARELDPDHPGSATIAAVLGGVAWAMATPEIGSVAAVLIAARIVVRSTGLSVHVWELAGIVAFAGYLAVSIGGWPGAIALVAAMWIDGGHEHRPHPPARIAALAAAVVAVVVAVVTFPSDVGPERGWVAPAGYLIGILAAWLTVVFRTAPSSSGDYDDEPLSELRLVHARVLAGAVLGAAAVLTPLAPTAYAPAGTALIAIAARSVLQGRRPGRAQ